MSDLDYRIFPLFPDCFWKSWMTCAIIRPFRATFYGIGFKKLGGIDDAGPGEFSMVTLSMPLIARSSFFPVHLLVLSIFSAPASSGRYRPVRHVVLPWLETFRYLAQIFRWVATEFFRLVIPAERIFSG